MQPDICNKMIQLTLTKDEKDFDSCALLISQSDPWVFLKFSYELCREILKGESKELYMIHENEVFAGFVILQLQGLLKGYVQSICLRPEFRGKGIGTTALKFCEERIFRISPNMFICVSSFNHQAKKLYLSLGFEQVGEFKDMSIRGHSELLLRKTIGTYSEFIPVIE